MCCLEKGVGLPTNGTEGYVHQHGSHDCNVQDVKRPGSSLFQPLFGSPIGLLLRLPMVEHVGPPLGVQVSALDQLNYLKLPIHAKESQRKNVGWARSSLRDLVLSRFISSISCAACFSLQCTK